MRPREFPEANKVLMKPEGMTEEECGDLHVYNDGYHSISLWRPSFMERMSILFFGKVWLYVVSGKTQPPVTLWGTKNVFKKAD